MERVLWILCRLIEVPVKLLFFIAYLPVTILDYIWVKYIDVRVQ